MQRFGLSTRGERMAEAYVWDYDRGCQDILMSRVD